MIDDSQGHGDGSGVMPFRLWPAQVGVMRSLMAERRVVILKARQLGISWICCGYVLWLCLFHPGKVALLFSKGQEEANELIRRIVALYDRLPPWLKARCPLAKPPNVGSIHFANGSRVKSLPATATAGSSYTASFVLMDEAAKMQYADALYTSAKPTIDAGGQLVVLSTAFGVGGMFHRTWSKAIEGGNAFKAIFLPWWSRPGRDRAWYDRQLAEANDPAAVRQEYPSNPVEPFLLSGRTRFDPEWINRQAPNVRFGITDGRARDAILYTPPPADPGRRCVLGADVAEGLESGDYSAGVVLDAATGEELAAIHGHWEPGDFADRLWALATLYAAAVVVERNNHGHAVLMRLAQLEAATPRPRPVGRLPAPPAAFVADGPDGRPGWLSTAATKPQAIDRMAELLRDGGLVVRSAATLAEMQVYRVLAGGRTGAPESFHDDRVMAWAAAVGWLALCGFPTPQAPTYGRSPAAGYRG